MKVEELLTKTTIPATASTSAPTLPAASGDLITNAQVFHDAEMVHLSFDYASGTYNAFQLFVDADQSPDTGYIINGIGAEALFEDHTWNSYDGSGTDWKWQPTEVLILFDDTGNHVSWNISRTLLNSSRFDYVFQLVDASWSTAFVTQKATYTIQ